VKPVRILLLLAALSLCGSAYAQQPQPQRPRPSVPALNLPIDPLGLNKQEGGTPLGNALRDVVNFFATLTADDLAGASTLATEIPTLQDPVGKACWDTFAPIGALIKAHPLPQTLHLATDIQAFRLFSIAVKQVCAKPECSQVWSDLANQTAAIGGIPVPALSAVCAKIP
jgi:hypothetical protein